MSITNIDDLLTGTKTDTQPATPESQYEEVEDSEDTEPELEGTHSSDEEEQEESLEAEEQQEEERTKEEIDEYGNKKEPENKAMRDRLSRQARKYEAEIDQLRRELEQRQVAPEIQKAAKDFKYDATEEGDWQQQLASFVKQTVNSMQSEEQSRQAARTEQEAYRAFERKFKDGMDRFDDFHDVVSHQPIDDAMTLALRALDDPSAFIYAASKRMPEELGRISKLRDPYARMVEMGKLEERMRKSQNVTKAPRPLSRTTDNGALPTTKKSKEPSIEDLIAQSEAKKRAQLKDRSGGRR